MATQNITAARAAITVGSTVTVNGTTGTGTVTEVRNQGGLFRVELDGRTGSAFFGASELTLVAPALTRETAVAMTMLVIKDADAEHGSTEVYAFFASLEDAIDSALAQVEARGNVLYKHQRDQFTVAGAEAAQAYMVDKGFADTVRSVSAMTFLPELDEDGTPSEWADSDAHTGAIYASELSA